MVKGKQAIESSRSDVDAVADMAIEWPDSFKRTNLAVARPALANLVSRLSVDQVTSLALSHPCKRQLLSELALVYRHSPQDLSRAAQLILEQEDALCEPARQAFADGYWPTRLSVPTADMDWRRAYDLIRFAHQGFGALQVNDAMPTWIGDEPIGLRCSRRGTERLVEELHAALRAHKLVSDVVFEDLPLVFTYSNPDTIPGMKQAKAIGGHDPLLGFSHIGAMIMAIAGYLDRCNIR